MQRVAELGKNHCIKAKDMESNNDWVSNIPATVRECLRAAKQIATESTASLDNGDGKVGIYCSPDRVKMLAQLTDTIVKLTSVETERLDLERNRWSGS